jgi:hypothetical protein
MNTIEFFGNLSMRWKDNVSMVVSPHPDQFLVNQQVLKKYGYDYNLVPKEQRYNIITTGSKDFLVSAKNLEDFGHDPYKIPHYMLHDRNNYRFTLCPPVVKFRLLQYQGSSDVKIPQDMLDSFTLTGPITMRSYDSTVPYSKPVEVMCFTRSNEELARI